MARWSAPVKLAAAAFLFVGGCGGSEVVDTTESTTTTATGTTGTTGGTTSTTTGSTSTTKGPDRCDEEAGRVTSYSPTGERDRCQPLVLERRETTLFSGDRLTTDGIGSLTFDTRQLTACDMKADSRVVVRPDSETELQLLDGTIGCTITATGIERELAIPGARVRVRGTLLILTATGGTSSVKVYDGTVDVRSTSDPSAAPVQVSSGNLAEIVPGQTLRTAAYTPVGAERALVDRLRLGILTFPPEALSELAQGGIATRGTLVTETEEQAKFLAGQNVAANMRPITTASLRRRSARGLSEAKLVVCVGSFAALVPAFEQLRRELGPDATLVFSPYSFPADRTTPTTTTTPTSTATTASTTPTSPGTTTAPGPP